MERKVLYGIPVSSGIAIGRAYFLDRQRFGHAHREIIARPSIENEIKRLESAFAKTEVELSAIKEHVPGNMLEHSAILDAHLMILADEKFRQGACSYVAEMCMNAEWAIEKAVADIARVFNAIEDEYIRERVQDVRLVAERVRRNLPGQQKEKRAATSKVILLAHDLTPADTIELETDKIMGLATVLGGKTSHAGIMARAMQIPAIVGLDGLENSVPDDTIIILDGFSGRIIVHPEEEELAQYAETNQKYEDFQKEVGRSAALEPYTTDGYRLEVLGNVDLMEDVPIIKANGGEGVGLYRTEYAYIGRLGFPEEQELVKQYERLAKELFPSPVVIRTIDLGSDKIGTSHGHAEEANPALGLRGTRFCLRYPDVFKTQLRAIMRAALTGNLSVMLPMISGLSELEHVREIYSQAQAELQAEGADYKTNIPFGIMIELPSAVWLAEELAQKVDFFSIGTNDLIQYTLGIDRTNSMVSYLYQPLHPAVVRSMRHVVRAAKKADIPVCVCGEMASNPYCLPILVGMEVDQISLNPHMIPASKRIVRDFSFVQCRDLLEKVLANGTVAENNQLMQAVFQEKFPEETDFYAAFLDAEEM